ncbi:hypothetical protein [Cupriavidus pinatubonensis]|uniref:Transmembrane protein n=1 Tax=Cupriavidus pinatubonensis TaxID=248026 RepID=A0ABN7Z2T3_9BURK|nr:hypothetical protein [Cupriavidus pinatubonensis]CAG9178986.1 hypothetical protein LMG23994_04056 [Cupriavidus pinatubonensis]
MSDAIIAGRFDSFAKAETTASRLRAQGVAEEDLSVFYVNPPGQHATYPIGGDSAVDPGARRSGLGALTGVLLGATVGAAVGAALVTMLALSPPVSLFVLVFTTGLGAYAGSLVGALSLTRSGRAEARGGGSPVRNAGVLLAAHVEPGKAGLVCDVLRKGGARDIERAQGHWREGRWADFDPLAPPVPAGREGEPYRA